MPRHLPRLLICAALIAAGPVIRAAATSDLTLTYDAPAAGDWMRKGLPVGNGHMGAMVYGDAERERIQFNEETLWTGDENDTGAFQNFGEVTVEVGGSGPASDFRRELDLARAVQTTTYTKDGVRFTREIFASFPAKVVVMRFAADKPGALSATISLADAHGAKTVAEGADLRAFGAFPAHDYTMAGVKKTWKPLAREARLRAIPNGGVVSARDGVVRVEKADSLVIVLTAATDFKPDRAADWRGAAPAGVVAARLDAAQKAGYQKLLTAHLTDYQTLFGNTKLVLGAPKPGTFLTITTDRRIAAYRNDAPDLGLEVLLFQFGRYLLIASSREGGLPATLQGKWNNSNNPPWRCDYHADINVAMNYWASNASGLNTCCRPFIDWIDSTRAVHTEKTKAQFKIRGWTVKGENGAFGGDSWKWLPATSAWFLQNCFDYWAFTRDDAYLREKLYPTLKEVCHFWFDYLNELPDGTLVSPNGFSPEHGPQEGMGVSFDQQLVWDLFTNTMEAADALGVDKTFRDEVAAKREKLLKPKIGKWGQLQEWMEDRDDPKDKHRHFSHLIAVHPGRQITPRGTPDLARAVRTTLDARGDAGLGWSSAWKINLWARLHDGDRAHRIFGTLIRPITATGEQYDGGSGGLYANMLTACPPFQIDANFGYTSGVCEMLIQSHAGEIELLPALPKTWPDGKVAGLGARGAFTVDMEWAQGRLVKAVLGSKIGGSAVVRLGDKTVKIVIKPGKSVELKPEAFQARAGTDERHTVIPLSDESPVSASQGWGTLAFGKSAGGTPLSIGGVAFASGLGMHSNGEAEYDLDGAFETFEAKVGVDDAMKGQPVGATVVFQVLVDGVKKFDSGLMRVGDAPKPIHVDVRGALTLRLVALDGGDGVTADHADWGDANLTAAAGVSSPEPASTVISGDMRLTLDKNGSLSGIVVGGKSWPVSGGTTLAGCRAKDPAKMERSGTGVTFTRMLEDAHGHHATVTDSYSPNGKNGVRWKVEIKSDDAPWSCAITSRLRCADTKNTLFWTAWGSPDLSGKQLDPALMARVQEGKASVSSAWSDPLVPCGFPNRSWHYGNIAQGVPVGDDFVELPLASLISPKNDSGLSLVLSPEDVMLAMKLSVSAAGSIRYSRAQHRLGDGKPVVFHMDLVPHEADWRGGLRFMTERYPDYFEAPNPRAHMIAACGAYSTGEEKLDVAKFKKMAFGFNWKLSDDFPYMGMFIPPVKSMDEVWTRSCGEKSAEYVGPTTSCRRMNDYAKWMKDNGFSVLSYFNVTEFGKDMNRGGQRKIERAENDPELWKDPAGFVRYTMPEAIVDPGITTCYWAYVMDPGEPKYLDFLLEQAKRNCDLLPDTDGICIDRADWLRYYNRHADDGVTWLDGKPARSLFRSWLTLMEKMGPLMHTRDKVIFSNMMPVRLELMQHIDGIYTEFGQNGNALNSSALLGLRKPVVCWTYNETINQPNPDGFMQRHLHMGCFPTVPYPHNNHCINPEPKADQLYQDYGNLLNAIRGKKWVLTPHCVATTTPGTKVNLFEVPGGYALPVTFAGNAPEAIVRVRNIPGLTKLRARALHPGAEKPVAITTAMKDGLLELTVPIVRGCALVVLNPDTK